MGACKHGQPPDEVSNITVSIICTTRRIAWVARDGEILDWDRPEETTAEPTRIDPVFACVECGAGFAGEVEYDGGGWPVRIKGMGEIKE